MIDVSAINAFIIWQEINHGNRNICTRQRQKFLINLGQELCGITKNHNLLHQFLQLEKCMILLMQIVLHGIRETDLLCVTERRTENGNFLVLNVENMYVLNTRTLSASTVLSY